MGINEIVESVSIGLIVLYHVYKKVTEYIVNKKHNIKDRVEQGLSYSSQIYEILVECRVKHKANRISVSQVHNGDYYLSNKPIMKISMTHETTDVTTNKIIKEEQNVIITKFPEFFKDLLEYDIVKYNDIQNMETYGIIEELKFKGVKSFYASKILNQKKDLIGFIGMAFTDYIVDEIDEIDFIKCAENVSFLLRN